MSIESPPKKSIVELLNGRLPVYILTREEMEETRRIVVDPLSKSISKVRTSLGVSGFDIPDKVYITNRDIYPEKAFPHKRVYHATKRRIQTKNFPPGADAEAKIKEQVTTMVLNDLSRQCSVAPCSYDDDDATVPCMVMSTMFDTPESPSSSTFYAVLVSVVAKETEPWLKGEMPFSHPSTAPAIRPLYNVAAFSGPCGFTLKNSSDFDDE